MQVIFFFIDKIIFLLYLLYVIVICAYTAENEDELTIEVGDLIRNVFNIDEGWYSGTLNSKEGMFPSTFAEVNEIK